MSGEAGDVFPLSFGQALEVKREWFGRLKDGALLRGSTSVAVSMFASGE